MFLNRHAILTMLLYHCIVTYYCQYEMSQHVSRRFIPIMHLFIYTNAFLHLCQCISSFIPIMHLFNCFLQHFALRVENINLQDKQEETHTSSTLTDSENILSLQLLSSSLFRFLEFLANICINISATTILHQFLCFQMCFRYIRQKLY